MDRLPGGNLASRRTEVVVLRDTLMSLVLLGDTRVAYLRDRQGDNLDHDTRVAVESELAHAEETLTAVRNEMKAQRHTPTQDVRHPMLEMSDKIAGLREAVMGDLVMAKDTTLLTIMDSLADSHAALTKHLTENYNWD